MTDILVPTAPPLATIANVELVQTGTWHLATGIFTFTVEDLISAVAALDCPAVRRPVLKLGHDGNHGIGEPAVGYVDNMAVADNGRTLVGDYTGMPGWLGEVIASAYPDRSVEGTYDFVCQMGHLHPFVIEAVALLGVESPGVGSLASLQDVAALYGVQLAAASPVHVGARVEAVASRKDAPMPNPQPRQIAASVSTEDVRRAFYESPTGSDWDAWIEELQLDPELQLIYVNDREGERYRVPVSIGTGEGADAVSFGDPVRVLIRYDDAPANQAAAASADKRIRFASRAESRPGTKPAATPAPTPTTPPAAPAAGPAPTEGAGMDPAKLREALGLAEDASDEDVASALAEHGLATPATPADDKPDNDKPALELPDGVTVVDESVLEEMRVAATRANELHEARRVETRDALLDGAVKAGKFAPARREHFSALYDADPEGTAALVGKLAAGTVPVASIGHAGDPDLSDDDALYRSLFGDDKAGV